MDCGLPALRDHLSRWFLVFLQRVDDAIRIPVRNCFQRVTPVREKSVGTDYDRLNMRGQAVESVRENLVDLILSGTLVDPQVAYD
jgi:hypothetical protein